MVEFDEQLALDIHHLVLHFQSNGEEFISQVPTWIACVLTSQLVVLFRSLVSSQVRLSGARPHLSLHPSLTTLHLCVVRHRRRTRLLPFLFPTFPFVCRVDPTHSLQPRDAQSIGKDLVFSTWIPCKCTVPMCHESTIHG